MSSDEWWNRVWGWQLFAYSKVLQALEADLLEQHDLPITWFDLLNRLREAPDQRLRMSELEERSLFTKSGLTRLVDRIEEAGFVRRERSREDRRAVFVAITDAGNEKIDSVWADHMASIYEHFGSHLTKEEGLVLESAAKKILGHDEDASSS